MASDCTATPSAMPANNEDNQNMISNLPLLFANGYPISLEKISEKQLEKFIPFMVQCSMGNVHSNSSGSSANTKPTSASTEPEWWPDDLPFVIPFTKPKHFSGEWLGKLKEIVCMCYEFHNNVYLLRFCKVLSNYEPECLRFINNYNSTTSLYDRFNNKLLVTFRNENMLYDQQYNQNRICLLPRRRGAVGVGGGGVEVPAEAEGQQHLMVEPPLFDIYLCDHCDAELYSLDAYREHERNCRDSEDDDVIICEPPTPDDMVSSTTTSVVERHHSKHRKRKKARKENIKKRKLAEGGEFKEGHKEHKEESGEDLHEVIQGKVPDEQDRMRLFLMNFNLGCNGMKFEKNEIKKEKRSEERSPVKISLTRKTVSTRSGFINTTFLSPVRTDRKRKTDRNCITLNRCPTIPLSSPVGTFLLKKQKTVLAEEYLIERQERVERFCTAPVLLENVIKPKWFCSLPETISFPITYRKPDPNPTDANPKHEDKTAQTISFHDPNHCHRYKFPRRQFSTMSRDKNFLIYNSVLLRQCKPCSVNLSRMTDRDIRLCHYKMTIRQREKELYDLRREDSFRQSNIEAVIDLCSSDEEDGDQNGGGVGVEERQQHSSGTEHNENDQPGSNTREKRLSNYDGNFYTVPLVNSFRNQNEVSGMVTPKAYPYSPMSIPKPLSPSNQDFYANVVNNNSLNSNSLTLSPSNRDYLNHLKETHKSKMLKSKTNQEFPSSILFLTKQQVRYQQMTQNNAEVRVVHAKEVENEVLSNATGSPEIWERAPETAAPSPKQTTTQQIFDQKELTSLNRVTSTTSASSSAVKQQVGSLRLRRATSSLSSSNSNVNGVEEATITTRHSTTSSALASNKKIPSLIRISTISGK